MTTCLFRQKGLGEMKLPVFSISEVELIPWDPEQSESENVEAWALFLYENAPVWVCNAMMENSGLPFELHDSKRAAWLRYALHKRLSELDAG